ncbi:MAG: transcription-repair coupling factor [Alicyclobacillaceae bacterium]|jgi:transcription-repair coupling factor (superfamily II helicase)|uniref:transcription-repair coupling factor n=1 Tax=Alicyclobacillus sp. SP_1 TaxID=2942475 RepID=UPI00215799FB|nr:transcription-repair coupling factor [Alicyclobacillus sp. SP_1]MCY0887843.1 transcription-repair coupling factor [Alicyclobacillaceae bacterium]
MLELARMLAEDEAFAKFVQSMGPGKYDGLLTGLGGSARHLAYAAAIEAKRKIQKDASLLVVTHSASQADIVADDLRSFLPEETILVYPEREFVIADILAASVDVTALRLQALCALMGEQRCVVVTTIAAVAEWIGDPRYFRSQMKSYRVGDTLQLSDEVERLVRIGYERVDLVERAGHFSLRGGILDIYPLTEAHPVRIELFDTDIDSIRTFDIVTQRSLEKQSEIELMPAIDILFPQAELRKAAEAVEGQLRLRMRTVTDLEVRDRLQEIVQRDVDRLLQAEPFFGQTRYMMYLKSHTSTLLDYLPKNTLICMEEPTRLQERERSLQREFNEWLSAGLLKGELLSGSVLPPEFHRVYEDARFARIQWSKFQRGAARYSAHLALTAKDAQNFHGQMNVLRTECAHWRKSGYQLVFVAPTDERAERMERVLEDYRIPTVRQSHFQIGDMPQILIGDISAGFELPSFHLVVVTDQEVFGNQRPKARRARLEMTDAERIKSYQDLKPGDYVVHVHHGIGKYVGIRTLEIDGHHKDYLHLIYAGNDSLYVPVEQIDQVQRYIGSEDKEPKVYHLGGGDWTRVKNKVSKTVRDIAADLVKLYAAREATPGHAFAKDTAWQADFEGAFPYEETPDQLRAIEDIKRDMERGRPMDRLLCGDVGYGKTEVAIRAAFKAVMDGKQVAVLVPTTVLAQQHYETFKERFSGFPVTVEVLSRFRSRTEAQACIKGLKDGSVDIVIGTHRLLQKSIAFKDLGLLIVDEEQRFGVTHKERLKQLRANVDCLTLTATPIPRTLHMSMMGVRDLSVIETPPENRFPVQTYVMEYNDGLVREALERELGRGGQVYFLYNQVQSISSQAERLQKLVPGARIGVAHGQLAEDELERVMLEFLDGEIDILVTTTIIETGLDIPNVNTLVVHDADRLGLSQLYQLRGRVGRSNRIAYAYFMYQKDKVLTEVAEKRLQAIKEFTELGSGFKIAMRDLAIRGAGNLLGAEQHGFINSVGFDMYSEMLAAAVKELRGEAVEEQREVAVELSVDAYLPDEFIPDAAQKISMYKKFKFVHTPEQANDLEEELEDRYGDLPSPVRNLLDITRIKGYAGKCGVDQISQQGSETALRFLQDEQHPIDYTKLQGTALKHAAVVTRRPNGTTFLLLRTRGLSDSELLKRLVEVLRDYTEVLNAKREVERIAK